VSLRAAGIEAYGGEPRACVSAEHAKRWAVCSGFASHTLPELD
jgi:hypothetical protein